MAWVLRRESALPLLRDITKCVYYHLIHLRAIPFFGHPHPILTCLLPPPKLSRHSERSEDRSLSARPMRGESLRFVAGRAREQFEHHQEYRWQPCSASWSLSRV